MGKPTSYSGTAFLQAKVSDFPNALNPENWSTNAGQVWRQSYLVQTPPLGVNPPGTVVSPLPIRRAVPPPDAGPATAWNPPGPGLFFEDVLFGGFRYRNVLKTSYADLSGANPPSIKFHYEQYECLSTTSLALDDGGVDVDNGRSSCVPDPSNPTTQVQLDVSKTVRFTQPEYCLEEVNALAEVLVPLSLDIWLQTVLFNL